MVVNGQAPFCRKRFLGVITRKSQTVTAVSWNSIFNSLNKGRTNSKLISSRLYNKPLLFIYFHFLKVHALIVATLFIHFISSDIALFWISEFSCSSILLNMISMNLFLNQILWFEYFGVLLLLGFSFIWRGGESLSRTESIDCVQSVIRDLIPSKWHIVRLPVGASLMISILLTVQLRFP